jgi:hypothetical protein
MKRHAVMALLNVTIDADFADDDAEIAMVSQRETFAKGTAVNRKYDPREQSPDVITKEQFKDPSTCRYAKIKVYGKYRTC